MCQIIPHGVLCFVSSYSLLEKLVDRWRSTGLWGNLSKVKTLVTESRNSSAFEETLKSYYGAIKTSEKYGRVMSFLTTSSESNFLSPFWPELLPNWIDPIVRKTGIHLWTAALQIVRGLSCWQFVEEKSARVWTLMIITHERSFASAFPFQGSKTHKSSWNVNLTTEKPLHRMGFWMETSGTKFKPSERLIKL